MHIVALSVLLEGLDKFCSMKIMTCQLCLVISVLRRLRQGFHKFMACLGLIVSSRPFRGIKQHLDL